MIDPAGVLIGPALLPSAGGATGQLLDSSKKQIDGQQFGPVAAVRAF
jgi:hypothetical protein